MSLAMGVFAVLRLTTNGVVFVGSGHFSFSPVQDELTAASNFWFSRRQSRYGDKVVLRRYLRV